MAKENANSHLIQQEVDLQKEIVDLLRKELDVLKNIEQKNNGGGHGGDGGLLAGLLVGLGGGGKGSGGAAAEPEAIAAGRQLRINQQKQIKATELQAESTKKQTAAQLAVKKVSREQKVAARISRAIAQPSEQIKQAVKDRTEKVNFGGVAAALQRLKSQVDPVSVAQAWRGDKQFRTGLASGFRRHGPDMESVHKFSDERIESDYKKHKRIKLQHEAFNAKTKFTPVTEDATFTPVTHKSLGKPYTDNLIEQRKWNIPSGAKGGFRGRLGAMDAYPVAMEKRDTSKEYRRTVMANFMDDQSKKKKQAGRATFTPVSDETPVSGGGGKKGGKSFIDSWDDERWKGNKGDKMPFLSSQNLKAIAGAAAVAIPLAATAAVVNTFAGTARIGSNQSVYNAATQEAMGRPGSFFGMAEIAGNTIGANIGTAMEGVGNFISGIMKGPG